MAALTPKISDADIKKPTFRWAKIESLTPYAKNPRHHSEADVRLIAWSLHHYGWVNPIQVQKGTNLVIAGHGRLEAAKLLGLRNIPVVEIDHNEQDSRAYRIADNAIAELSEWDLPPLKEELVELDGNGFNLGLTGFSDERLEELMGKAAGFEGLTNEDDAPAPPSNPITQKGDAYEMGRHRLLCADASDPANLDGVEKVDAVYTDPPYGIGLLSKTAALGKSQEYRPVLGDDSTQTALDAYQLAAALKPPIMVFWGANHYASGLPNSSGWIVWDKQGGKSVTYADCELAWTNQAMPARVYQHIWDGFRRDSEKGETRVHPTQKPVALAIWCLSLLNAGGKVLDFFGGSGSTLIACEKTERSCLMMELDPAYCDVIVQRWEKFTGKKAKRVKAR
jgi:16S rRNA G966 N2-methylase RsmD